MNFELIRSFVTLADTCHYGEAARRLNLSQPALSKHIRRFEDLIGAQLFNRSRQGTELTALGRHLVDDLRPVLALVDAARDKILRAARGERGRLSLGFTFSSLDVMTRILSRFRAAHPDIEVDLIDRSSHHQVRQVRNGELDIGFVRLPVKDGLSCVEVARDRLALVYPADMALTDADLDDPVVRSMPLVALSPDVAPGVDDIIQRLLKSHDFEPRLIHRVHESMSILRLVAAGFGVALMHETAVQGFVGRTEGIAFRPILDPAASWDVGLIWRDDDPNPVLARFLSVAFQTIRQQGSHSESPRAIGLAGSALHSASEPS